MTFKRKPSSVKMFLDFVKSVFEKGRITAVTTSAIIRTLTALLIPFFFKNGGAEVEDIALPRFFFLTSENVLQFLCKNGENKNYYDDKCNKQKNFFI